jgi:hypothetical protein
LVSCRSSGGRPPDVLAPLSERRYKIQLTADQSLHHKVREAQNLLGHRAGNGDLAEVFDRALDLLVKDLRKKKFAETDRPRRSARPRTGEMGARRRSPKAAR